MTPQTTLGPAPSVRPTVTRRRVSARPDSPRVESPRISLRCGAHGRRLGDWSVKRKCPRRHLGAYQKGQMSTDTDRGRRVIALVVRDFNGKMIERIPLTQKTYEYDNRIERLIGGLLINMRDDCFVEKEYTTHDGQPGT
jgi:hypothetical protein